MGPRFRADGCCLLDFYLLWTEQAIDKRDPDAAYNYARQLAHMILELMKQREQLRLEGL